MSEHILTIIDTRGNLREVDLDTFQKSALTLGRDREQCDIVIPDQIVSKLHGRLHISGDRVRYQDLDSRNGTFLGLGAGRQLLGKADGWAEVFDKTVLCIGNLEQAENMVLLLYSASAERELWKREPLERADHRDRTGQRESDLPSRPWSIEDPLPDLPAGDRICAAR